MMVFDYVYLLWELTVNHTADYDLAMSSDVLMIAHKLFIVALKRVVVTFECSVFSRLCDTLIHYKWLKNAL